MTRNPNPETRYPTRHIRDRGFTLIEAALTTVIVGTGVLSIVAAQQAYHQKNDWAQRTGTAMLLANEVRELTLPMPMSDPITGTSFIGPEPGENSVADYDDLDDFAGAPVSGDYPGVTFSPPIDAMRRQIADMPGWSQHISVASVLEENIGASFTSAPGTTNMLRLSVDVLYQGPNDAEPSTVTTLTWVIGN
jgi:Tfp pilus assembly protein PilV